MIKEIKERAERAIQKQRKEDEKKRIDEMKREAAEKRRKQQEEEDKRRREEEFDMGGGMGGMPGGMGGGMGGMPGGMAGMNAILSQLMQDPEIANLLKDPEAQKKLMGFFMSGGAQYADDPLVKKVTEALQKKFPQGAKPPGGAAKPPSGGAGKPHDDLD